MYSTSTPYTKMKPVRAALTFFAAELVEKSDMDQMGILRQICHSRGLANLNELEESIGRDRINRKRVQDGD